MPSTSSATPIQSTLPPQMEQLVNETTELFNDFLMNLQHIVGQIDEANAAELQQLDASSSPSSSPSSGNLRKRKRTSEVIILDHHSDSSPREQPKNYTDHQRKVLCTWLAEHKLNPYPTEAEKKVLVDETQLSKVQIDNWFVNARKRKLPKLLRNSNVTTTSSSSSISSGGSDGNNNRSTKKKKSSQQQQEVPEEQQPPTPKQDIPKPLLNPPQTRLKQEFNKELEKRLKGAQAQSPK